MTGPPRRQRLSVHGAGPSFWAAVTDTIEVTRCAHCHRLCTPRRTPDNVFPRRHPERDRFERTRPNKNAWCPGSIIPTELVTIRIDPS